MSLSPPPLEERNSPSYQSLRPPPNRGQIAYVTQTTPWLVTWAPVIVVALSIFAAAFGAYRAYVLVSNQVAALPQEITAVRNYVDHEVDDIRVSMDRRDARIDAVSTEMRDIERAFLVEIRALERSVTTLTQAVMDLRDRVVVNATRLQLNQDTAPPGRDVLRIERNRNLREQRTE